MLEQVDISYYEEIIDRIEFRNGKPYWVDCKRKYKNEELAGTLVGGYRRIRSTVNKKSTKISAHRLLWYKVHKTLPLYIDHINYDRDDNRIENIREVTSSQNNRHKRKLKSCSSDYTGVTWAKNVGKWTGKVNIDGKRIYLGYFLTEEECAREYDNTIIKYDLQNYTILNFKENTDV